MSQSWILGPSLFGQRSHAESSNTKWLPSSGSCLYDDARILHAMECMKEILICLSLFAGRNTYIVYTAVADIHLYLMGQKEYDALTCKLSIMMCLPLQSSKQYAASRDTCEKKAGSNVRFDQTRASMILLFVQHGSDTTSLQMMLSVCVVWYLDYHNLNACFNRSMQDGL